MAQQPKVLSNAVQTLLNLTPPPVPRRSVRGTHCPKSDRQQVNLLFGIEARGIAAAMNPVVVGEAEKTDRVEKNPGPDLVQNRCGHVRRLSGAGHRRLLMKTWFSLLLALVLLLSTAIAALAAADRTFYRACCVDEPERHGCGISRWYLTAQEADDAGARHEEASDGHQWTIQTITRP